MPMWKTLKRYLYLIHRWLGVAMCLLIALWFATGVIMMYIEYPELTEAERVVMQEPVAFADIRLDAAAAAQRTGLSEFSTIKLMQVLGRPAYAFTTADARLLTVFADNGEVLQPVTAEQSLVAAQHSGFAATGSQPVYDKLVDIDQWTVTSSLNPFRPLHKVAVNDEAGTELYISSVTGQVVRDSVRNERFWNWLGSTIHWIYPWQLRQHADLWADLLTYISLAGVISVFTGAVIGILRLRVRHPYKGKSVTPYHGYNKWHHVLGLGFLIFVSTFMFSGLMSMLPWGLFDNVTDPATQIERYAGSALLEPGKFPAVAAGDNIKEILWQQTAGVPTLIYARSSTDRMVVSAEGVVQPAALRSLIDGAVAALQPAATMTSSTVISGYDNYYYSHHNRFRPLPALRVEFDDAEQSWYYIDLTTGTVVQRLTHVDRVSRWLYNGMHSLDFTLLFQHRPVWDVSVILLCILGFLFSVTSVVLGWRRLTYRLHHR